MKTCAATLLLTLAPGTEAGGEPSEAERFIRGA